MGRSTRLGLVLGGLLAATAAVVFGLASAQTPDPLPKGPYVDFCPTPEQTAAHMEQYGFDYKPTVPCTADGEVEVAPGQAERQATQAPVPETVQRAREKSDMSRMRRAPDTDGNPATLEAVTPEGEPVTIYIQTSEPERFRGMTPAEFARKVYP
jgi:hypothetical protein